MALKDEDELARRGSPMNIPSSPTVDFWPKITPHHPIHFNRGCQSFRRFFRSCPRAENARIDWRRSAPDAVSSMSSEAAIRTTSETATWKKRPASAPILMQKLPFQKLPFQKLTPPNHHGTPHHTTTTLITKQSPPKPPTDTGICTTCKGPQHEGFGWNEMMKESRLKCV